MYKEETEKLQRLQNRSLRLCFNINIPTEINTVRLRENAQMEKLCDRRDFALLCMTCISKDCMKELQTG